MKKILAVALVLTMLLSLAVVGASALSLAVVGASALSPNVDASTWESLELKALYVQSDADIYSDLDEDYWEYWWEDEVPESDDAWLMASTINMRGFAMSPDGRYLYMGQLNGGTGVRGVVVYDTQKCVVTDLYYHYDGEAGLEGSPYSYAKGIAADDRGYVYVGYAFSLNYNLVNLGIAQQKEDGALEEVSLTAAYAFGEPGDAGGIHVGVNGVDVVKVGDSYYCYVMINYDYDALYCFDVTDPANPKLNKDFGDNGLINFSDDANPVVAPGYTLKEGQYMDVDDDGVIWLVVNTNEGMDGVMKISPNGSSCVSFAELQGVYSVEHEGGFLLCGMKDGSAVVVLDDASFEQVASVPVVADYGDRIVRVLVVNDVLFVADAGNDTHGNNAVHAAPLTADGQEFFDSLVANFSKSGEEPGEDSSEAESTPAVSDPGESQPTESDPVESGSVESEPVSESESASTPAESESASAPAASDSAEDSSAAESASKAEEKSGCGATVLGSASVLMLAMAAAVVLKKKD